MPATTTHHRVCAIMAGGSGERFWPLSRRMRPKQLLRLTDAKRNLLEVTVDRVAPFFSPDRVFVATGRHLQEAIRRGGAGVPDDNVLAEPAKRNTAGCLAYVAARLMATVDDAEETVTMAVLSADHLVEPLDPFLKAIETALEAAENESALVVMGVEPSRPETGYGYIEVPEGAEPVNPQADAPRVLPVAAFREKPDEATAETYAASGRHFWNSGMFFWTLSVFLRELERSSPDHAKATREMAEAMRAGDDAKVERLFEALEDISIDYALMERAGRVLCVRAEFDWDDIGAWDALDRTWPHDDDGNVVVGEPVLHDVRDSIVYNEVGAENMAVAVVGVEGLAVIVSPDGVLVIPKERAQDTKKAVNALKERGAGQL